MPSQQLQEIPADEGKLATIGGLVAPLLATMGLLTLTGTVGRVQRDRPIAFSIALGLVILAGVLWAMAPLLKDVTVPVWRPGKKPRKQLNLKSGLRGLGMVVAGAGFILALVCAVAEARQEPRPRIAAKLSDDRTRLTGTIDASNLASTRRVAIKIDMVKLMPGKNVDQGHPFIKRAKLPIERAYIGPDGNGDVHQALDTALPAGRFDDVVIKAFTGQQTYACDDFRDLQLHPTAKSNAGCVILSLAKPRPPAAGR